MSHFSGFRLRFGWQVLGSFIFRGPVFFRPGFTGRSSAGPADGKPAGGCGGFSANPQANDQPSVRLSVYRLSAISASSSLGRGFLKSRSSKHCRYRYALFEPACRLTGDIKSGGCRSSLASLRGTSGYERCLRRSSGSAFELRSSLSHQPSLKPD